MVCLPNGGTPFTHLALVKIWVFVPDLCSSLYIYFEEKYRLAEVQIGSSEYLKKGDYELTKGRKHICFPLVQSIRVSASWS